jgi:hypothetical protein
LAADVGPSADVESDDFFLMRVDGHMTGPTYVKLSEDEWHTLGAIFACSIPEGARLVIEGAVKDAHYRHHHSSEVVRLGALKKKLKQFEEGATLILAAAEYPGAAIQGRAVDTPPDEPFPPMPDNDGKQFWRALVNAGRRGDGETQDTISAIDRPKRFLQEAWLWGYVAHQAAKRLPKDRGGRPRSIDQWLVRRIRSALEAEQIVFSYRLDPDDSIEGPAVEFVSALQRLRPQALEANATTLRKLISHSKPAKRRTEPR